MLKSPETYLKEDLDNYVRLLKRTNALDMPHKTNPNDRPKRTTKWNFFKEIGLVPEAEDEVEDEIDDEKQETGSGYQGAGFLTYFQKLPILL